jgi:hypothetical protein
MKTNINGPNAIRETAAHLGAYLAISTELEYFVLFVDNLPPMRVR